MSLPLRVIVHDTRAGSAVQVNARKIYDEPNALAGILDNKLFVAILAGEAVLQARIPPV